MIVRYLTFVLGIGPAIVRSGIFGITILTHTCFSTKFLWIVLAALPINHAGCIWVLWTTRIMYHALCDKGGMGNRVRDLGRDNGVYMSSITDLKLLPQQNEEMDVRQTMLLELYGKDKPKNIPKETILYVFEHGVDLWGKDTCNNVRTIRSSLMCSGLIWIIIGIIGEQIVTNL